MHDLPISLTTIQLARCIGLVRRVEAVPLPGRGRPAWGLRVYGRGFVWLLKAAPRSITGRTLSGPERFITQHQAQRWAKRVGLIP